MVKETEQGKKISQQLFRSWLTWVILVSMLFGSFAWGISGKWQTGTGITIFMLLVNGAVKLLLTGFRPIYIPVIELYKRQEKSLASKDLQVFQLPRTITVDDKWLEIRSSEAVHRWRWRQVDQISLTSNFIFIHVGNWPVVYVPKRDFQSEQRFIEFGNKLVELKEKYKDQPIGTE